MADLYAPLYPSLAALAQGYLGWRERQVNQSRLADLMLPKALPEYAAGLAYGTLPSEPPLTSVRSTAAYGSPALDVMGYAPGIKAGLGALATIGRKAGTEAWDAAARAVAQGRRMVPPGQVNIFAGPNAKTANQQALNLAQGLYDSAAQGRELWRDPAWLTGPEHQAIYERTGWFLGPEGKWRFEINDQNARLNPASWGTGPEKWKTSLNQPATIKDAIQHDELFKAYPDLADIPVNKAIINNNELGFARKGEYNPKLGTISVESDNPYFAENTFLHELQHAIQKKEGFAPGGSPGMIQPYLERLGEWNKHTMPVQARQAGYERIAGEVEARATERRRMMNMEDRLLELPYESYDTPLKKLIFVDNPELAASQPAILNQADPATRAMIANDFKARGLRDVQITDGVIRDEIARRNAVTMLGLPEGNTAADRAKVMGYTQDAYRGSFDTPDFSNYKPYEGSDLGGGMYFSNLTEDANRYANRIMNADADQRVRAKAREIANKRGVILGLNPKETYNIRKEAENLLYENEGVVLPAKLRTENTFDLTSKERISPDILRSGVSSEFGDKVANDIYKKAKFKGNETPLNIENKLTLGIAKNRNIPVDWTRNALASVYSNSGFDSVKLSPADYFDLYKNSYPGAEHTVIFDPSNIRSRFAAFDPARAKEADILAGLGAAAVTTPAALSLADYFRMRDRSGL